MHKNRLIFNANLNIYNLIQKNTFYMDTAMVYITFVFVFRVLFSPHILNLTLDYINHRAVNN